MENDNNTIKCPECGAEISVTEILYHQVHDSIKKDFDSQTAKRDDEYKKKLLDLQKEKEQVEKDKETTQQQIENSVKEKLDTEKTKLEKSIRFQIEEEKSSQVKSLEDELKIKSEQVKELNKTKADIARLQREKEELRGSIEAEEAEKFNKQLTLEKEKLNIEKVEQANELIKIKTANANLQKEKEELKETIELEVSEKFKIQLNQEKEKFDSEKTELTKNLRLQIEEEKSSQVKSLEEELKQKSEQVKELNKTKADIARLQREKEELRGTIEAEESEKFNVLLTQEKEKIKSVETEKSKTELQKRDKLIEDLTTRLTDAQTKLEQGSNKLAGEVKEIELRDFLKATFPIDEITDVPSGITGADVYQVVRNNVGQHSGIILYERKQTQTFGKEWISKLKEDGRRVKADICVIVTRAMPKENSETHFNDGVWICTFEDLKIITTLLRDGLLKQYAALKSQSDKGTKMEILYDYLRSNDFQNHITGILDAFRKMDKSLHKEKEDTIKRFAEREAHIFQAKQSILSFWGRIDGIASDSLSHEVRTLESTGEKQIDLFL